MPLIEAIADNAPLLAEGKDNTFANRIHETLGEDEKTAKPKPVKAKAEAKGPQAKVDVAPPNEASAKSSAKPQAAEEGGPLARGLRKLLGR